MCLFFIVFQDKEKESTQQMGILQEVRILFFLSCPSGLGKPVPSPGIHRPSLVPHSVFHVLCCLGRPVFALDHVALFACARGRHLSGAWSSWVLLPPGIVINHSMRTPLPSLGAHSVEPACPPSPIPVPSCPYPCLCEWGCACPVSGVGGEHGRQRWPPLCVSCTRECPVSAMGALTTCPPPPYCCSPGLALGPSGLWGLSTE